MLPTRLLPMFPIALVSSFVFAAYSGQNNGNDAFFAPGEGNVQPGGTCASDEDCADSPEGEGACLHYWHNDTAHPICMIVADGELGSAPCIGTRNGHMTSYRDAHVRPELGYICDMADGIFCNATEGRCEALRATDESCSFHEPCVENAYCNTEGVCAARLPVDSPCTTPHGDECAQGTYCDADAMTCAPQLADGASCTVSGACQSGSCVDGRCEDGTQPGAHVVCGD